MSAVRSLAVISGVLLATWQSSAQALPSRPHHAVACCRAVAGTAVEIELAEPVSTKTKKTGDTFALRLAEPLVVGNRLLLRAGTPGVGEVIEASRPGMGGKAAKLVLAARYLQRGRSRIALRGLQLSASGRNQNLEASAVGLTGIAFAPLGFIALAVKGGDVDFPAGMTASAKLASTVVLPSLGKARPNVVAAAEPPAASSADAADADAAEHASIDVPPPPPGKGQVVFFRRRSILGTAQWFKVRENGKALGKLTNGAYFVQVADPGLHTYTATFEPELKDHLTLQIDPGETYFVEGTTTHALIIGAADLTPSDKAAFEKASSHLKPAPTLVDDPSEDMAEAHAKAGAGATPPPPP
jgi:hypothetical protein